MGTCELGERGWGKINKAVAHCKVRKTIGLLSEMRRAAIDRDKPVIHLDSCESQTEVATKIASAVATWTTLTRCCGQALNNLAR